MAVNSWAQNLSCAGKSGGYRVDQPDDLDWLLSEFGISAANTGTRADLVANSTKARPGGRAFSLGRAMRRGRRLSD